MLVAVPFPIEKEADAEVDLRFALKVYSEPGCRLGKSVTPCRICPCESPVAFPKRKPEKSPKEKSGIGKVGVTPPQILFEVGVAATDSNERSSQKVKFEQTRSDVTDSTTD